jgi:hypothetical protein
MDDREPNTTADADPLEALLRNHLRGELDGQLGRSEARFTREVAKEAVRQRYRGPSRLAIWGWWAAAVSAASVGIVWGMFAHRPLPAREIISATTPASVASAQDPEAVGEVVEFNTIDEGTLVLENEGPARQLRRQVLQTTQWYDPQTGGRIEVTVPQEQVVLIGLPSY